MKKNQLKNDNKFIEFQKKMGEIFETNYKNIKLEKKLIEFKNFDSLKILEIITFYSSEKININPNKITDKIKFHDLFKFYKK